MVGPYLLLGEIDPDSGVDPGHGADRDGYFLAPPKMPLLEEHVSHPAIARGNKEALDPPDLAIDGVDPVTRSHPPEPRLRGSSSGVWAWGQCRR